MEVVRGGNDATAVEADAVVVGVHCEESLSGPAAALDQATGGLLAGLIERKEFTGKAYELLPLVAPRGIKAQQALLLGLGARETFEAGAAFRTSAAAARQLAARSRGTIAFCLDRWSADWNEAGICGAIAGCQGQDLYRTEKCRHPFQRLLWPADDSALETGQILGESVNFTRSLVNSSPDEIYPATFADIAVDAGQKCGFDVEVWDRARLEQERCGSLLAVAKGSSREPRLIILRYRGAEGPPLGIVGKGVTFDSGGLSLKTPEGMLTMKCDMAGAATMLGALRAIALLKLPVHIIGFAGLVENMTGPAAMKLGDVLKARSGRTIEVHNTDAEGRLVLADVLSVAVDQGVAKIVDLATLTGACVVALGTEVAGVMTNEQSWCDQVVAAANRCGEHVWQLPMFPEVYNDLIKSEVADIKNVGEGRWGGAITAAKFLEQFVAGKPWTHIDIAGPAFRDKPKPWSDAGASGQFVRTLVELARSWKG